MGEMGASVGRSVCDGPKAMRDGGAAVSSLARQYGTVRMMSQARTIGHVTHVYCNELETRTDDGPMMMRITLSAADEKESADAANSIHCDRELQLSSSPIRIKKDITLATVHTSPKCVSNWFTRVLWVSSSIWCNAIRFICL